MSYLCKGLLFVSALLIVFAGCSASESSMDSEEIPNTPAWFVPSGFGFDSLAYHGYAVAVSSDSVIAVANAELQARVNLEAGIAQKLEEVREELQKNEASIAIDKDFIITLRNAHQPVEEHARKTTGAARVSNGYYTGFAQVSITKSELKTMLESGFKEKTSFWSELNSSPAFLRIVN